jgi:hypothetical protein
MRLRRCGVRCAAKSILVAGIVGALAVPVLIDLSSWVGTAVDPSVGEIARFTPAAAAEGLGRVVEVALRSNIGRNCVLDSDAMATGGGSLVVAGQADGGRRYMVHWAGTRTSYGAGDCGRSAELVLSRHSLVALIAAAEPIRAT